MIQRDFIKRQLEELGRAISKVISDILNLKEEGKFNDGINLAQDALKNSFGLDLENVFTLSLNNFVEILINEKEINSGQLNYLGDVLYETAALFENKGEIKKSKELYKKVLAIYSHVDQTEKTFSTERNNKMESIKMHQSI